MAGKKLIHKNICTSDKVNSISEGAETMYIRLLVNVDDYGHISANSYTLKDICYPKRKKITPKIIRSRLSELVKAKLVRFYTVHEVKYLEIIRHDDFQIYRNDRKKRENCPQPKGFDIPMVNQMETNGIPLDIPEVEVEVEVEAEVKHTQSEPGPVVCVLKTNAFSELWEAYPNKDGRKAAEKAFRASVKTSDDLDDIKQALSNYLGSEKVQRGFIKNGSTWFNNWRDWINYRPITAGMRTLAAAKCLQDKLEKEYSHG